LARTYTHKLTDTQTDREIHDAIKTIPASHSVAGVQVINLCRTGNQICTLSSILASKSYATFAKDPLDILFCIATPWLLRGESLSHTGGRGCRVEILPSRDTNIALILWRSKFNLKNHHAIATCNLTHISLNCCQEFIAEIINSCRHFPSYNTVRYEIIRQCTRLQFDCFRAALLY